MLFVFHPLMLNGGGVTQIQAELGLLACATDRRKYAYYHLLSGMDLPLKSQTDIHSFSESNSGKKARDWRNLSWCSVV